MAFTYPVTLNLNGKFCTVVGGGAVALRKVKSLLEEGAEVTVISPKLIPELQEISNQFVWMKSNYKHGMLKGSFLVIVATDNRETNHAISEWCQDNQILVNIADSPEESSFTVNSSFRQGDLLVAVSTNGASPAVSAAICRKLEKVFGPEYATMLEILKEARKEAKEKIHDKAKRREFLQQVSKMNLIEKLRTESREEVQEQVKKCQSSYWD